jgi:disulfide oxidoreductase YuzD
MKIATWKNSIKQSQLKNAVNYLSLLFEDSKLKKVTRLLNNPKVKVEYFKASDLIRAARQYPFDETDENVIEHKKKIKHSEPMEPVILVHSQEILYIADGYHRVCACYMIKNDMKVAAIRIRV